VADTFLISFGTVKTNPSFSHAQVLGKKVKRRRSVIFEDTPSITTLIQRFRRDFFIVDKFIFQNNRITLLFSFTFVPKTGMGLPKTGVRGTFSMALSKIRELDFFLHTEIFVRFTFNFFLLVICCRCGEQMLP